MPLLILSSSSRYPEAPYFPFRALMRLVVLLDLGEQELLYTLFEDGLPRYVEHVFGLLDYPVKHGIIHPQEYYIPEIHLFSIFLAP
ncbi:hypothetical protein V3F56_11120 [Moorellaceae bacterium AZ2]